jgi:hypothetical protein
MWRQGDVLIAVVDAIPDDAVRRSDMVLAEGEITGHRHRVQDQSTAELWAGLDGLLYLRVIADTATLVHEEHGPITLERGLYRVWRQREYTPDAFRTIYD